jgi:regulator of CtrA degradation
MSNGTSVSDAAQAGGVTISFGEHFQASGQFDRVFKEGMALVERTAAYLDGPGRQDSKILTGQATVLYATESMRLTTRLLDLASWLLIRRSLKEGEITDEEAHVKRRRIQLKTLGRPSHTKDFSSLPEGLKNLIDESFQLHDRIVQFDRAVQMETRAASEKSDQTLVNPVAAQIERLHAAFGTKVN